MGLIDRITAVFRRTETAPARTTEAEMPRASGGPLELAAEWRAASDRKSIIRACRDMYAYDTRGEAVIGTLARDIVRGGFSVAVAEAGRGTGDGGRGTRGQAERAQEAADALITRLSLDQRLDDWVRLTLRDGDSFLELAVDADLAIVSVTRKPALEVRRASNAYDRFDDPVRAFWQGDEWAVEAPGDAVWFAEWQVIHARWDHDEGSRYGRPLFASATKSFKRITEGETDMAVRRKTRAGRKYSHQFPPGTDRSVIEEYKILNRDSINNPLAAIADFFGTVEIKAIDGDMQLGQIDDVMHHIRTWWLASPVAMSLLGYGQDLNRDVLAQQSEQYHLALEALTAWPETEIVKPLLERQWLLAGILPAGLAYTINWRNKEVITAAKVDQAASAALKLKAIGASDEVVGAVLAMLLPNIDAGIWSSGSGAEKRIGERASAGRIARVARELGIRE